MKSIRTLNMVWEQRFRGAYPVSRYALNADGTLALAIPRPLEARSYDITQLGADGAASIRAGFAVETLIKLDVASDGSGAVGMTTDDIYLFRGADKSRFLSERHVTYIDAAQSADGRRLAVVFSDIAGASFAAAFGETSGHVEWTMDIGQALSAIAISRDGERAAIGSEAGMMWLVDGARRRLWEFGQEHPIRTLACSEDGSITAYGTANGAVGAIDSSGDRRWKTEVQGDATSVALSGDGALCAVLSGPNGAANRLTCIVNEGQIAWEYESDKRLVSLAVSPNGHYVATGARDGTATLYAVVAGEATTAQITGLVASDAASSLASGNPAEAYRALRTILDAGPANADLCAEATRHYEAWTASVFSEVSALRAQGDTAAAMATLERLLQAEPGDINARSLLAEVAIERADELVAEAARYDALNDAVAAERALREAIALRPLWPDPRRQLAALQSRRASEFDAQGDSLLAQGELETGVSFLERAQALAPTPERAAKMARAQTAQEFALGMGHYNSKRYREAVFQFKKVVTRDPDHTEAKRYLGYAQGFLKDAGDSLSDRFSRLE